VWPKAGPSKLVKEITPLFEETYMSLTLIKLFTADFNSLISSYFKFELALKSIEAM